MTDGPIYYFAPDRKREELLAGERVDHQALGELGLAEVLADCSLWPGHLVANDVQRGPGDSAGVILLPVPQAGTGDLPVGYHPDRQVWTQRGPLFVGYDAEHLPGPLGLGRRLQVPGVAILDDQGRTWHTPVARGSLEPTGTLPTVYDWDEAGSLIGEVHPQYADIWQLAGEVWDYYNWQAYAAAIAADQLPSCERPADLEPVPEGQRPPGDGRDKRWLVEVALQALGVNYRIGRREIGLLKDAGVPLLDSVRVEAITRSLVHWQIVEQVAAKKKQI